MREMTRWVAVLSMAVACSSPPSSSATDAAQSDATVTEVLDLVGDSLAADATAVDAVADSTMAVDADVENASDASVDAAPDAAADSIFVDAAGEVAQDAADDAGPDAVQDVASDTLVDAADVPDAATQTGDCPDRAKIIYIVSQENKLLSFDPDSLQTKVVGELNCPGAAGTPFSMGVDRFATAWVLYGDGNIFEVSTLDASCKATAYTTGQSKFDMFGMAFAADSPGAVTEKLYVVGGGKNGFFNGPNKLATIDLQSFVLSVIAMVGPVSTGPDLSGNGNGELWGFFANTQPASVRQIDKVTAQTGKTFLLPDAEFGSIGSWAFASWGGDFYLFSKSGKQTSTAVYKLSGATGDVTKVIAALGYSITGAGVSSCAPTKAP